MLEQYLVYPVIALGLALFSALMYGLGVCNLWLKKRLIIGWVLDIGRNAFTSANGIRNEKRKEVCHESYQPTDQSSFAYCYSDILGVFE